MQKKIAIVGIVVLTIFVFVANMFSTYFGRYTTKGSSFSIQQIDLSQEPTGIDEDLKYLYETTIVDLGDGGEKYLAHPDSIVIQNQSGQNVLHTFYVLGHGKGALAVKTSTDGGLTYSERLVDIPESWSKSEETPTVFELDFVDGTKKIMLVSGCPKWAGTRDGDGFCVSILGEDGQWSEFERFFGKDDEFHVNPIVAMSSLVHLKENGEFVDKWMGFFHDDKFKLYCTTLSFEGEKMIWSKPKEYLKNSYDESNKAIDQRHLAKMVNLCEVLVVRSESGNGDILCMIGRSNTKRINSLMAFSYDEGKTWSQLKEVPAELNGERHKAIYDGDRLFITFRSIERDPKLLKQFNKTKFVSDGWVAWVGTFDSLLEWYKNGTADQTAVRIKLAHIYLDGQTSPQKLANSDTGYCGVCLIDGYIVVTTYGRACPNDERTMIISKRLNLSDIDKLRVS